MNELHKFEGKPVDIKELLGYSIANIIASMEFGERFEYSDKRFQQLRGVTANNSQAVSSMAIRVFFPWSKYIPYIDRIIGHVDAM